MTMENSPFRAEFLFPAHQETASVTVRFASLADAEAFFNNPPPGVVVKRLLRRLNIVSATVETHMLHVVQTLRGVVSVDENQTATLNLLSANAAAQVPFFRDVAGYDGSGVKVAILDSGYYPHPAYANRVIAVQNFTNDPTVTDVRGHGTYVTGIVASSHATNKGVAPGCSLLIGKVFPNVNDAAADDIAAGIEWAVESGADVINLSLGFRGVSGTNAVSLACQWAVSQGVVVVASAGNEGPGTGTVTVPGTVDEVITVGAVNDTFQLASFSSRGVVGGSKPDIVAPGVSVTSTANNGGFRTSDGTSAAAPIISGIVALMLQARPRLKPNEVKNILKGAARSIGLLPHEQGAGVVDAKQVFVHLGNNMTLRLSTALKNALLTTDGIQKVMQWGVIEVYDGEQPLSADDAPIGNLVGRITDNGTMFVPHTPLGGLRVFSPTPGVLQKDGVWTFKGVAAGTARWFRWKANKYDPGVRSPAYFRLDGKIGTDLRLSDTNITPSTQFNIQDFTVCFQ